ncbi:MAG: hypothetical protein NTW82_14060 [Bacteroidia bacterium]|nr:hypothetical protein [Bacteroidia bacterium]
MAKKKQIVTTTDEIACFIVNLLHGIAHDSGKVMRVKGMRSIKKAYVKLIERGALSTAVEEYQETMALQYELDIMAKSKQDEHR